MIAQDITSQGRDRAVFSPPSDPFLKLPKAQIPAHLKHFLNGSQ